MTRKDRLWALWPQGLELMLIGIVAILSLETGVERFEVAAHALFAVSTMAMINCVNCCREVFRECFDCVYMINALRGCGKHTAIYRRLFRECRGDLIKFLGATVFSGGLWVFAALYYAQSLQSGALSLKLIVTATMCSLLAAWKVWGMTKFRRELSVAGIAFALIAVDVEGELVPLPKNPK